MRKENFGHGYVLDPCCGGKSFYFDKEEAENVVDFIDKRRGTFTYGDRKVTVDPDEVGDFTNLNDTSVCLCEYNLVVFDPPHLTRAGEGSYLREKYGVLPHDWEKELSRGFSECFRTLCDGGVLAFKWSDYDIPFKKVIELAPYRPLFGDRRGRTRWTFLVKCEALKKEIDHSNA